MAEFVWFFGASGAGKSSLINKIAEGQFNVTGIQDPVVCKESLEFGRKQRELLLEKQLGRYALLDNSVLIKGQSADLSRLHIPARIHERHPEIKQRMVFVYARPDLLLQRTSHRKDDYWPNPSHDFVSETAFQIDEVGKLCDLLKIEPIIIDNSRGEPQAMLSAELSELLAQRG